jgi:hypothetical protein
MSRIPSVILNLLIGYGLAPIVRLYSGLPAASSSVVVVLLLLHLLPVLMLGL